MGGHRDRRCPGSPRDTRLRERRRPGRGAIRRGAAAPVADVAPDRAAPAYNARSLVCRFFAQRITPESFSAATGYYAITYRPGGYTGSFKGRTVLPVGTATKFVLSYDETPNGGSDWAPLGVVTHTT